MFYAFGGEISEVKGIFFFPIPKKNFLGIKGAPKSGATGKAIAKGGGAIWLFGKDEAKKSCWASISGLGPKQTGNRDQISRACFLTTARWIFKALLVFEKKLFLVTFQVGFWAGRFSGGDLCFLKIGGGPLSIIKKKGQDFSIVILKRGFRFGYLL